MPEERLSADPETFVREQRRADPRYIGGEDMPADALNDDQRLAFEHIVECFRWRISEAADQTSSNTIIMGTAGVGKSFLIRLITRLATQSQEHILPFYR